jgi:ABC-type polysaccharide/polyol phosphate transport system ATPase subunit
LTIWSNENAAICQCTEQINKFREQKKAIIFVPDNTEAIKIFVTEAACWIMDG